MSDKSIDDPQVKALLEMMQREEPLHPALMPYFEDAGPMGFPSLRHPLVYSIVHSPMHNAMVNQSYLIKKEAVTEAMREGNWHRYVYLHERPWRIDAFETLDFEGAFDEDHPEDYWKLLGSIWTDSENIWQNEDTWREFLGRGWPGRESMMNDEERAVLTRDLNEQETVYRGFCHEGREQGLSWTNNSVVGKFFSRRLTPTGMPHLLATGWVNREDIIAYFDGRSEQEIVVDPSDVHDITIKEIPT